MSKPLDELYFIWLYGQVGDPELKSPARTYWKLLRALYTKEFVWVVPNDDNRMADGKDLRDEFVDKAEIPNIDEAWLNLGCSMLEVIIGLSRRLAFEAEGEPRDWFWHLMENLGLDVYSDKRHLPERISHAALDRVIWRTYEADGQGGLFPLKNAREDQRGVELWYQLNAYVLELD